AAIFTAAASAASPLAPIRVESVPPRDGNDSSAASAASAAHATPLGLWKGKTIMKYAAKLFPTKYNGKLVGDKGASGSVVLKALRYSSGAYANIWEIHVLNIPSGGKAPYAKFGKSCTPADDDVGLPTSWVNVTKNGKMARRNHYSFAIKLVFGAHTLAEVRRALAATMSGGSFLRAGHSKNDRALCGKITKVV
ncbi:unnamed protein product, partial [Closterium sp. Naga37s-1]